MPELPEVETSRRWVAEAILEETIDGVSVKEDPIVFANRPPKVVEDYCLSTKVRAVGRKGKLLWLNLDDGRHLVLHLGMSGQIHVCSLGKERSIAYRNGAEPKEKFRKLTLQAGEARVRLFDARRFARVWLWTEHELASRLIAMGPDVLAELPSPTDLSRRLRMKRAPIKSALLDQTVLSGLGNYLADEVLFQARIAPHRQCCELSATECQDLCAAIDQVCRIAVEAEADSERYPADWLFHVRWGKGRDGDTLQGETIAWTEVGGRTTAWAPGRQR